MINTGDKLLCTSGNICYVEGEIYTVGKFVNDKFFEIMTGANEDRWYASNDNDGIHVCFNSMKDSIKDAWFDEVDKSICA